MKTIKFGDKSGDEAAINIIRRFKNHCNIYGFPSKSFEDKVKQWLKQQKSKT